MKKWLFLLAGSAIPIGLIAVLLMLLDIRDDRKHTVIAEGPTPVFAGTGDEGRCSGTQLSTVEPGTRLRVQRIRYLKECATLDIVLPDGRKSYFVLGVGHFSVNPPLNP